MKSIERYFACRCPSMLVVLVAAALACNGCSRSADQPSDAAKDTPPATQPATTSVSDVPPLAQVGTELLTFKITGMHCSGCATGIQGELTKMAGVRQARVSFANATAWVMLDKAAATNADQIMETIQRVGYKSELVPATQTP